ncbi:VacJ family lipoprotein [Ectothiorhodospiraceae bacterium 2226]|nr:VacJ family lipoprotein [Ectothiorhodospiraceae bacterium 2226]
MAFAHRGLLGLIVLLLASGCASTPPAAERDPRDPFERYNRAVFQFNDTLDSTVVQPLAEQYVRVVPSPARSAVSNFFGNLGDVVIFANNVLQLKGEQATNDFVRIMVNSTFGLFGLIDIASEMGIEKNNEDFGQTLGYWGVPPGPYLMLPVLGPSTVRDGIGVGVDAWTLDPVYYADPRVVRYSAAGIRGVDTRAELLGASRILEEMALDRYAFLRDAYLQRRLSLVYDGEPPEEAFEWDDAPWPDDPAGWPGDEPNGWPDDPAWPPAEPDGAPDAAPLPAL